MTEPQIPAQRASPPTPEPAPSPGLESALAVLNTRVRAIDASVRGFVVERPLVALGTAAGVGFLVGGGFAAPALRGIVRVGAQLAVAAAGRSLCELVLNGAPSTRTDVAVEPVARAVHSDLA